MTSYEFEKAAKNAVIKVLNENINIDQLDLVWFAHELGYKKVYDLGKSNGYKVCRGYISNGVSGRMYVDIYRKISNTKIPSSEFNFEA